MAKLCFQDLLSAMLSFQAVLHLLNINSQSRLEHGHFMLLGVAIIWVKSHSLVPYK